MSYKFRYGSNDIEVASKNEMDNLESLLKTQKVLWSGNWYMNDTQTAELSEPISEQKNGIVLVFRRWIPGDTYKNERINTFFVCKKVVELLGNGRGHSFLLSTVGLAYVGCKYLYIHDTKIVGNVSNDDVSTASGITYTNNQWVLSYVIGV